jgi:hypothetical protein
MTFWYFSLGRYCFWPMPMAALTAQAPADARHAAYLYKYIVYCQNEGAEGSPQEALANSRVEIPDDFILFHHSG